MISSFCLLEGDLLCLYEWGDHSELADHSNCCTSLCSLQIRSMGAISGFFLLPFPPYFSLVEQLKKDKVEVFPECCIVLGPAWCAEEAGREVKKSHWTSLTLVSTNCLEKRGSTETRASKQWGWGGRAVNLSSISLQNSCCSILFLFLPRNVLLTGGKAFYKYSVFIILLQLFHYAELRSIKSE